MTNCPFCIPDRARIVLRDDLVLALWDAFPVSPGHALIVPLRHVESWFDASDDERTALISAIGAVREHIERERRPDGYNIGINVGDAAGQTVPHLHIHVIPRFTGDMDDPRGGVRHVIPSKGNYRRQIEPLATGGDTDPFASHILSLFDQATAVAIVAAFVQESGLTRIEPAVELAVRRGARVRIITGDYLQITQAAALETLLDWQKAAAERGEDEESHGQFEARVIEAGARSFHPKAWRFESPRFGIAFVGSSNLSLSALGNGVEWNLRVDRDRDSRAYERVRDAFEDLWKIARPLDAEWIEAYAERARREARALPPGEVEAEAIEPIPQAHAVQEEALDALRAARAEKRRRALVVLPTGLGKTLLAAYDFQQMWEELGQRPRVLFVAHRRELLRQAATTFRRLLRERGERAGIGWFVEDESELSSQLVLASVAKLARPANLEKLDNESFDYVVIDEVHHAAADSYRKILDRIDPKFLLGLTATPDRADAADILGLFDDFIAYRTDVGRGITLGRLVPFHYYGVKDDIDYENIPWRNRRFDPEELAKAAETDRRMESMWRAWQEHPGVRSLVFCCSISHADFVRGWLRDRGIRVAAVYAGEGSDDRDGSLRALEAGTLDALCAVDVFNEGVDVPAIDRVVMLRPTESSVVFLQQLGRGLRASESPKKTSLTVIDFVGNHRMFLDRIRALLALGGREQNDLRKFLEAEGEQLLPAGCSVDIQLEAKDLLSQLFRGGGADEVERAYLELHEQRGQRPTAGELQRMGYLPSTLRERHGSWFEFVRAKGHLDEQESAVMDVATAFLREVETTEMTKCFKMVTLEAMIEARSLSEMDVGDLAIRSYAILRRSPELFDDIAEDQRREPSSAADKKKWIGYWRRNPIEAWTSAKKERRAWFRLRGPQFVLDLKIQPELAGVLSSMTRELVDYRLAQYRARRGITVSGFVCKVIRNERDPILKLPQNRAGLPEGTMDVRLRDGSVWQFRFAKEFCNVAKRAGAQKNQLPDLLREWFGPRAGQPGTAFQVRFVESPDGLWAEPIQENVVALRPRKAVVAYPDLPAAAGHAQQIVDAPDVEHVFLPLDKVDPELFAVRVSGSSMDGGKTPLRDGDWAVMRVARAASARALENRVVLVEVEGPGAGSAYQIKRLVRHGSGWLLTSDNPDGPTIEASEETTAIARLESVVRPEDLAPATGSVIREDELAARFGIEDLRSRSGRYGGHLFIFIDKKGVLTAPHTLRFEPQHFFPSETAYVLASVDGSGWRYLGVAHRQTDTPMWSIPDVDFGTWREWGEGKEVSRQIPQGALSRAQIIVDSLLSLPEKDRWIERPGGRQARILGEAQKGGLRIDGGEGGFAARTVSILDLAWVVIANDDVEEHGGLLDEERVNRLRYLEGTPKGSTRWIDTGWGIAAWRRGSPLVPNIGVVHRDNGEALDATFRVEQVDGALNIVIEARGGTRGSSDQRNADYAEGLGLILRRLEKAGAVLEDALVDSNVTAGLSVKERRLQIKDRTFPFKITDADELRKAMSAAQAKVGRAQDAKGGGNQTKRLRLIVTCPAVLNPRQLMDVVGRSKHSHADPASKRSPS